jgi:hypothetical protein
LDLVSAMQASFWAVATMSHTQDLQEGIAAASRARPARFNQPDGKEPP